VAKTGRKKKVIWQQYVAMAFMMLIGAVCGILVVMYMEKSYVSGRSFGQELVIMGGLFISLYASIFLHLIIHEAGHLIFGLLTGYQFSSFRIMSFMWVKEKDRIKFRRLTVAGTGGQCLMAPPEFSGGNFSFFWYNLGGALANVAAGIGFLTIYFACREMLFFSTVMLIFSVIGFTTAMINGIPMRLGMVDNDGYNAFALKRNNAALRAFWVQLKVNEQIAAGVRLKDMPDEWFEIPDDSAMKNSMVAAVGVFACNRLMDGKNFAEANCIMEHLLEIDSGMVGLHRNLLICDRIYLELIGENRRDTLKEMMSKEQKKFMKSMKKFPSVLRTQYAHALLSEQNEKEAKRIEGMFWKCAETYPYPNDIQSERELMEIARIHTEKVGEYT